MNYNLFILFFILFPSQIFGCFSSGNPAKGNPEKEAAEKLKTNEIDKNEVIPLEKGDQSFEVDKNFVLDYLKEFGHLSNNNNTEELNETKQIENGIKNFQEFINIPIKNKIDLTTLSRMSWKRCGNSDKKINEPYIWEKTSLNWFIDNYPKNEFSIPLEQLRGLIKQAFNAWEIVIALDFMEVENINDANIIFYFNDENENNEEKTELGIAKATQGPLSKIWLNKNQNWSIFQLQEEGKIDIFLTLIHEIGHSLGLEHNGDSSSVMFPLLERNPGEQLPVISSDDVEKLRNIYDNFLPAELDKSSLKNNPMATPRSLPSRPHGKEIPEKCPHLITAATNVLPGILIVFNEQYTWTIKRGNVSNGPMKISERFPEGPEFINASFSTSSITILIQGHTLYGYHYDEKHDKFTRAKSYPKALHSRILFYPIGAFPLSNGSIILVHGKIYATYYVETNEPHMLGNLDELFPNLPDDLLSGLPATSDFSLYYMLTSNLSFLYNTQTYRLISTQTIGQFIGCEKITTINSLLQQFNSFNQPQLIQSSSPFKNEFPHQNNIPQQPINNNRLPQFGLRLF